MRINRMLTQLLFVAENEENACGDPYQLPPASPTPLRGRRLGVGTGASTRHCRAVAALVDRKWNVERTRVLENKPGVFPGSQMGPRMPLEQLLGVPSLHVQPSGHCGRKSEKPTIKKNTPKWSPNLVTIW